MTQRNPCLLCDDDALIRWAWQTRAASEGVPLQLFESSAQLIEALENIPPSTTVYLDSQLEDGKLGVDVAKVLHERGFKTIICTTGYADAKTRNCPYFAKIMDKTPPW